MFQNRVAAIAIVVLTLAGVASLVGTEENEGALATATQSLAEKAAASSNPGSYRQVAVPTPEQEPLAAPPISRPFTEPVATEFADDESLIDDAQGFDPSPITEDPVEGEVVAIVEDTAPANPEPLSGPVSAAPPALEP